MSDELVQPPLGEALPADRLQELLILDEQAIDDAIDWFDEFASDEFFGALE